MPNNLHNLPRVVECGHPLAKEYRSTRTVLDTGRQIWARGACSCILTLVHRQAGYSVAGSAMRLDGEAWGCLRDAGDGVSSGQWFASEAAARAEFNRRNNAAMAQ